MFISVFSVELGSSADTCTAPVYVAFVEAHIFLLFTRRLCATTGAMVMGCRKMFGVRLWSTRFWNILGDDFWYSFLTLRFFGSTVDTCRLQSTRLLEEFHTFST